MRRTLTSLSSWSTIPNPPSVEFSSRVSAGTPGSLWRTAFAGLPGLPSVGVHLAMAFAPSNRLYDCRICSSKFKHFKLMESKRELTMDKDDTDRENPQYWRICVNCEVNLREQEFEKWSFKEKENDPTYPARWRVERDLKMANKGQAWAGKAAQILQAKKELKEDDEGWTGLSACKTRRAILSRAQLLAEKFLEAIQEAGFM